MWVALRCDVADGEILGSVMGRVWLLEHDDFGSDIKEYIAEREKDRMAWEKDANSGDEDGDEQDKNRDENEECADEGDGAGRNDNDNEEDADQDDNASDASEGAWSYNDEDPMDYANFLQLAMGHGSGAWDIWLDSHGCSIHRDQVRTAGWQGVEAVEGFYEGLERQLEELEIVPVPDFIGRDMIWLEKGSKQYEKDNEKFGKIYRECGWPGEEYRKEEAMEKIKTLIEQERAEEEEA